MFENFTLLWGKAQEVDKTAIKHEALAACKYQSSCNLTRQEEAKKDKKSLNIIHIGNIY
eukprot:CAMPEP_0114134366 /NCGR_PEP_ID=MMETSP0043_2-20121206/14114_1 /TAXON_ID=464988 /ORGANISM="Hemiselmis andersenii, Strain CCMP644" /LENGTH=58 /DNA_ID=CAMNT_0001227991 /DNA_START=41 /DNA_END=217 /DNA_ORIENTATION=+